MTWEGFHMTEDLRYLEGLIIVMSGAAVYWQFNKMKQIKVKQLNLKQYI
jgi:hypothetical protein